jgi:hypothetical protein
MAFRASNQIPARGYEEAKAEAFRTRRTAEQYVTTIAGGGNADQIYSLLRLLAQHRTRLQEVASIPGLADYARAQEADAGYDVAAEFNALVATVNATITWMQSAIPAAGGYDQMYTRPDGINLVPRSFTSAALAPLVTRLQAIAATVA